MDWVFCNDGSEFPNTLHRPYLCLMRKRVAGKVILSPKICVPTQELMGEQLYWMTLTSAERVQPYAYLDTSNVEYDEQFAHNLSRLKRIKA